MRWIFFKNPLRFLEKSSKYLIITYINILDCELSNVESNTTISPIIHSTSKQTSPKSKTSPMSPIEKSKREKSEAAVKKEELPSPNISNEKYISYDDSKLSKKEESVSSRSKTTTSESLSTKDKKKSRYRYYNTYPHFYVIVMKKLDLISNF